MEPTKHSVYAFYPPNGAQLVSHADTHVEIRFERTRAPEILKWFEQRLEQFRLELSYHMTGPVMLGQELPAPIARPEVQGQIPDVPSITPPHFTPGKQLPLGTLLSKDQVQQLMQRFPNEKLEGESLYNRCVELGFVKSVPAVQTEIMQSLQSLPIETEVAVDLTSTVKSSVDLEVERKRLFQEAVEAAVLVRIQELEAQNTRDTVPAIAVLEEEPRTIE